MFAEFSKGFICFIKLIEKVTRKIRLQIWPEKQQLQMGVVGEGEVGAGLGGVGGAGVRAGVNLGATVGAGAGLEGGIGEVE